MNANAITRNYDKLTPDERWRLILSASERGDEIERERLSRSGDRLRLALPNYFHLAQTFLELGFLTFIELADEAARYLEALQWADSWAVERTEPAPDDNRMMRLALASGYMLKAKAGGWAAFCKRRGAPAWLLWEEFPGYDRLRRALELAEKVAYSAEEFVRWHNATRKPGTPAIADAPLTVQGVADATEKAFRNRAEWWGG